MDVRISPIPVRVSTEASSCNRKIPQQAAAIGSAKHKVDATVGEIRRDPAVRKVKAHPAVKTPIPMLTAIPLRLLHVQATGKK